MEEKKKRILYCASTESHILNFHVPYLEELKKRGYEIWVAANGKGEIPNIDKMIRTNFTKSLVSYRNFSQIYDLRKVIVESQFDIIHTHTTLAAAIVRLAILLSGKRDTKVINTSHGYFFGSGLEFWKWFVFLPVEIVCGLVTDVVVTMNAEDFFLAKKFCLARKRIDFIHGMGVDLSRFKKLDYDTRVARRQEYGYKEDDFIMIYSAELSKRKNHIEILNALKKLKIDIPNIKLICAGDGVLGLTLKKFIIENELDCQVKMIGYCDKIEEIYSICDVAVSSSKSEGLPFNIVESMACGLPVIASNAKGHVDIIKHMENGLLYKCGNIGEMISNIKLLFNDVELRNQIKANAEKTAEEYSLSKIFCENLKVYS